MSLNTESIRSRLISVIRIAIAAAMLLCPVRAFAQSNPNPLGSFWDQLKQSAINAAQGRQSGSPQNNQGGTVIDTLGLRNVLPEYDPDESVGTQFPHIAITVLKSPQNWLSPPNAFSGCWSLSAVVWSDAKTSKNVGPFDWCMPQDQQIRLGPTAAFGLPTAGASDIYMRKATTGIHRTTGPRPPNTVIPDDARTHNLELQQGRSLPTSGLYIMTAFGTMVGNLLYQFGAYSDHDNHDMRVWIVSIDN